MVVPMIRENRRIRRLKMIASAETKNSACSVLWKRTGGNKSKKERNGSHGSGKMRTWLTTSTAIASVFTMIARFFGRSVPAHFSGFQDGFGAGSMAAETDERSGLMAQFSFCASVVDDGGQRQTLGSFPLTRYSITTEALSPSLALFSSTCCSMSITCCGDLLSKPCLGLR